MKNWTGGHYLIAFLLLVILIMVIFIIEKAYAVSKFDNAFDNKSLTINALETSTRGGLTVHPLSSKTFDVPGVNGSGLGRYPRSWNLQGCITVQVPDDKKVLYAAVPLPQDEADKINIQTPIPGGSVMNICGPSWISTEIYLWTE